MNVKEVMSQQVRSVRMTERADAAARILWEHDCGIVPVVDANNVLVGVVTDRDLCMASYTQGRPLAEIAVTAVMARAVRSCKPDETLAAAMAAMQQAQVHRLPVVDARGLVIGMLSVNDLIRLAQARPAALDAGAVLKTLAAIGAPRQAAAPAVVPPPVAKAMTVVAAASSPPSPAPSAPPVVAPKPAVPSPAPKADATKSGTGSSGTGSTGKAGKAKGKNR
ncbi:MAG: CBS domain-containing protein [Planctomycetes bacterium]|nr:CBS domain-containing protein [Planctomycetota bacterium]